MLARLESEFLSGWNCWGSSTISKTVRQSAPMRSRNTTGDGRNSRPRAEAERIQRVKCE